MNRAFELLVLGSSSASPTSDRNVSGQLLNVANRYSLIDCGEGTQMQLRRYKARFQSIDHILISHLHGDHFNGLPGLLSSMALDNRQKELTLVGPTGIREYLDLLSKLKICHVNYPLKLHEFDAYHFKERTEERVYESPRFTVVTRPLDHRIFALGFRLEEKMKPGRFDLEKAQALGIPAGPLYGQLQAGKAISLADGRVIEPAEVLGPPRPGKIVSYCLDTRPCDNAVILSRNADWLIHEATFTEDHLEESHHFGHSTAIQAAEIARAADAKRLLITHFSSRYGDTRSLLEEARTVFSATVAAEDLQELEV